MILEEQKTDTDKEELQEKREGTTQEEEKEREKNDLLNLIYTIYMKLMNWSKLLTYQAKNVSVLNQWASQSLITLWVLTLCLFIYFIVHARSQ